MTSLIRPAKRQKNEVDHRSRGMSSKSAIPEVVGCHDSTSLLSLVETFARTHFTCCNRLIEIIGKIRSNIYLFERNALEGNSSIQKLHGALILHIGFLLGSQGQKSKSNGNQDDALMALVLCVRDLYNRNTEKLSECIAEEEFNELFMLVPKILRCKSMTTVFDIDASQITLREKINICCYQIFTSWLGAPALLKKVVTKHTTTVLENFLLAFLASETVSKTVNKIDHCNTLEVLEQLRSLCDDGSEFRKLLDVSSLAIDSQLNSSPKHSSPRLNIFHWRCVSCVTSREKNSAGKINNPEIADYAVDSMISYTTSNNSMISRLALACTREFIRTSSYDHYTRLIQVLTTALLAIIPFQDERTIENIEEKARDQNLLQILECLGVCMKRPSAPNFFLRMEHWENVIDFLAHCTEAETNISIAEEAMNALVPILEALIMSTHEDSPLYFRKSMAVLLTLLSLDHAQIVERAVTLLYTSVQNSEIRRRLESSTLLPDLVNTLAELSSKTFFIEERQKVELARAFSTLIDTVKNVNLLARNASNLIFLVRLANGSYCAMNQNRVQEISICAIMKLARNPCNERILAKQPGLLSSLIRYTRLTSEDTQVLKERSVTRKELKDRILLMAKAL